MSFDENNQANTAVNEDLSNNSDNSNNNVDLNGNNSNNITESLDDALDNMLSDENLNETEPENLDGKQSEQNVSKEAEFDWTKDGRYEKMWKNPNDLYKSYRNAENQLNEYKNFKNNYDKIDSVFKERGLSVENLNEYIDEYTRLKDPNNPEKQDLDYLYYFLNKPEYSTKIASFFQELQATDLQARFPNMNREQIEKQMELENKVKQFEQERQFEFQQRLQQEYESKQAQAVMDIKTFAEKKGFTPNNEEISQFVKECTEKGVTPENLLGFFIQRFSDKIDEAHSKRLEESILKRLSNNKNSSVPNSSNLSTAKTFRTLEQDLEALGY